MRKFIFYLKYRIIMCVDIKFSSNKNLRHFIEMTLNPLFRIPNKTGTICTNHFLNI